MIDLRARDPKAFGGLYDCAQSSLELAQLLANENVSRIAAEFLKDKPEDLSFSGLMLRMDVPEDRRNVLTWHQDRAYYPQKPGNGENGLVYWVALQDVTEDMGALHICKGSHINGLVEPEVQDKIDYNTTEQRAVPADVVASYPEVRGTCKKGAVLLMSMDTVHRSGHNVSDIIRYSAIFRFHRMLADDYVPFTLLYKYNPYLMELAEQTRGN